MQITQYAALYCRLSKSDYSHDESNSIASQKSILEKAAVMHGYEQTRYFIDDGYSGTMFQRPALKQLEDAIEAGFVCAVLVKDVSRLGRDYLKVGYYLEQLFQKHKVRFLSVSGGIDSETNSTDFLPLYSVMDEWYAKDVSRKVRMMVQNKVTKGVPVGNPVYGYTKVAESKAYWVIDLEAAKVVRKIYQFAFNGYGAEQIAGMLEQEQILTPTQYAIANGSQRTCKNPSNPYHWASSTVSTILRRQEYCGDIVNLKTYSHSYKDKKRRQNLRENMSILRDVHDPIIERSLWEYIQHKLDNQKVRKKTGKQSLFSGFLRCGDCGSNLHYHFNHMNPNIEYYNCSNYVGNRGTCPDTHYVRLDALQSLVLEELNRLIYLVQKEGDGFWARVEQQKHIEVGQQADALYSESKSIDNQIKTRTTLVAKAYEDKTTGLLDDETFILLVNEFKKDRETLRKQHQQVQQNLETVRRFHSGFEYFKASMQNPQEIANLTRDILGQWIDWIAVHPADRSVSPYCQKTEIHYHFIGKLDLLT